MISFSVPVVPEGGAQVDIEGVRDVDGVLNGYEDCPDLCGRIEALSALLDLAEAKLEMWLNCFCL